jgi:hypothetical protein
MRSGRRVSPVALVLGIAGALLGALALSVLFSHPAGASTVPGSGGAPTGGAPTGGVIGVVSNPAQSAIAELHDVVAPPSAAPTAGPLGTFVQTTARAPGSTLRGLTPVLEPIAPTLASALGPVVATLAPVPTPLQGTAPGLAQPTPTSLLEPASQAATTPPVGATASSVGNPSTAGLRPSPGSPGPLPAPAWPFQGFPLVTSSSATGDASSSSGGNALAATPVSGPLLPDPPLTGVIPAQSGIPQFLFDLRSSPPG